MRVLYFGSDALSLRVLRALRQGAMVDRPLIKDLQVVTPPDRLAGKRQRAMTPCVLKAGAAELGLSVVDAPVAAPRASLTEWKPILDAQRDQIKADLAVVFSFGYFLPRELIESFPKGAINIHPSLLPKYRGPAPIQHALLNGDAETGVSLIEVDPTKFDSGDILMQERIRIDGSENDLLSTNNGLVTFTPLANKLSDIGAQMVLKAIEDIDLCRSKKLSQGAEGVSKAPKLKTEDKFISDWSSAKRNVNKFRAFESLHCRMQPGDHNLTFGALHSPSSKEQALLDKINAPTKSCLLMKDRKGLAVKFDDGWLITTRLKLEGKKEVSALEFFNGYLLRREKDADGVTTNVLS